MSNNDEQCPESLRNDAKMCGIWKGLQNSTEKDLKPWGKYEVGGFVPAEGSPLKECGWSENLGPSARKRSIRCLKKAYDNTIRKTLDTANKYSTYKRRELGSSIDSECFSKRKNTQKKMNSLSLLAITIRDQYVCFLKIAAVLGPLQCLCRGNLLSSLRLENPRLVLHSRPC